MTANQYPDSPKSDRPPEEPWLRGAIPGVPAHAIPLFHSFLQVREDLAKYTAGLSTEQIWHSVIDKHSLGYQLKHMAGSVDRLTTYLEGRPLSTQQLTFLRNEHEPDATLDELLRALDESLARAEQQALLMDSKNLSEARTVGARRLPTTVNGLLTHLCEHTQRHLGQAILIARLLRDR